MFKYYKNIFWIVFITVLIFACQHRRNVLCTTYNGTLPAASSVGIDTTINFLSDNRYTQTDIYLGEKDGTFTENGHYDLANNKLILISDDGNQTYYRLENKQIRRLNSQQKAVTGSLADFYVLKCLRY